MKTKTTLLILGQHALPIMEEETTNNKIIRWKHIFYHQESAYVLTKVRGGPNVLAVFLKNIF